MAEPPVTFAGLLRKLRTEAGLTQEELAHAASLSSRSISDLERGINHTARKDTTALLADALHLTGPARAEFEAIARGRVPATGASGDPAGIAAATRTLPRDIASFTGRELELRELVDAAVTTAAPGGIVGIHAIGGMAGVGKTAFAVHAAHRLAGQFPGGQIFLPLHGHTPGQRPVEPADALASLLTTTGVPAQQIPSDLASRLELMQAENLSVTAAFNLSYDDLSQGQQQLFRRLGLHPGAEIDSYAAAALADTGRAAVRHDLEALYDHYLLTEPSRGRYRLHDLLKEHARALSYAS